MIQRCPFCGGHVRLVTKDLLVQAGVHAALLKDQQVGECEQCGEVFYTPDTVRRMEALEERLRRGDVQGLKPIGQVFVVPAA